MFGDITFEGIKLSNDKTKPILLSRIKERIARLLLWWWLSLKYMKLETLDWTEKFLLLKIPTYLRYCERLTGTSKRKRPGTLVSSYKPYYK